MKVNTVQGMIDSHLERRSLAQTLERLVSLSFPDAHYELLWQNCVPFHLCLGLSISFLVDDFSFQSQVVPAPMTLLSLGFTRMLVSPVSVICCPGFLVGIGAFGSSNSF